MLVVKSIEVLLVPLGSESAESCVCSLVSSAVSVFGAGSLRTGSHEAEKSSCSE